MDNEEVNQYFHSFESLEDLDDTFANGQSAIREINSHQQSISIEQNFETLVYNMDNEILNELIDCIQHHQLIIHYCKLLKNHFSVYIVAKSIHSSLQLANLTFVLIKVYL